MAINERLIHTAAAAAGGGTGNQEEGLILHLDANDVDSYDGDGSVWYDITNHEYTTSIDISSNFQLLSWTGNGTSQNLATNFKADFWFAACSSVSSGKIVQDSVRGLSKYWAGQGDSDDFQTATNLATAFNDDNISIGNNSSVNYNGRPFRGFAFKAGGTPVSNTDGTQTTSVSVNTDIGFSIVKGSGNLNGNTYGHGLGEKPKLVILKSDGQTQALLHHDEAGGYFEMNNGNYSSSTSVPVNTNLVSSFTGYTNTVSDKSLYCFAEKRGFSKFGTYTGTSSSGNKVYCGFEPAFVMVRKVAGSSHNGFFMFDNLQNTSNPRTKYQHFARYGSLVTDSAGMDFDADGFTVNSTDTVLNGSSSKFLFIAFAQKMPSSLIDDTDLELHLDAGNTDSYDPDTDGSTWSDLSGNSRNATLSSMNASQHDKEIGGWFDFDGSDADEGTVSHNTALDITSAGLTVEAWVNPDDTNYNTLVAKFSTSASIDGYSLAFNSGDIFWRLYTSGSGVGTCNYTTGSVATSGTWHHIVGTVSGTASGSTMKLYQNGKLLNTTTTTGTYVATTRDLRIGGYDYANSRNFDGQIGQVRIYSNALTADQVMQNYRFTKNDYPNGYNGAISGADWNSGGYFSFDGSNDYVSTDLYYRRNNTVSLWVNFTSNSAIPLWGAKESNYDWIYCNITDDQDSAHNDYIIDLWIRQSTSQYNYQRWNNVTLNSYGNWNFLTFRMEELTGTNFYMSVNGGAEQQSVNQLTSGTVTTTPNGGINAGRAQSNGIWYYGNSKISKFKVHDKPLTSAEITALYNEGE